MLRKKNNFEIQRLLYSTRQFLFQIYKTKYSDLKSFNKIIRFYTTHVRWIEKEKKINKDFNINYQVSNVKQMDLIR